MAIEADAKEVGAMAAITVVKYDHGLRQPAASVNLK